MSGLTCVACGCIHGCTLSVHLICNDSHYVYALSVQCIRCMFEDLSCATSPLHEDCIRYGTFYTKMGLVDFIL